MKATYIAPRAAAVRFETEDMILSASDDLGTTPNETLPDEGEGQFSSHREWQWGGEE